MRTLAIVFPALVFFAFYLPQTASALTISPTKIEVAGDPGQTLIGEIEIFNEQNETKTFYSTYENFEPRGETGSPYFVGGGSGLASWLSVQESFSIQPGARLIIPYTLTIPANATPGGYFAAVFFGTQPPATGAGSEVAIGGKVGSLVLLRVNGAIDESGGILDFATASSTRFFTQLPVSFTYRFNNTGGDRVVPKGEIRISNTFGRQSAVLSLNKNEGSVLPASIRKFQVDWGDPAAVATSTFMTTVKQQAADFHFGFYHATLDATWGESNQNTTTSTWFLIIPWQLLSLVIFALVVLRFGLKFYNQRIIARARQ